MSVLYLGSFFPENEKQEIVINSVGVIQNAGDTYQKALIKGLIDLNYCHYILTSPLIGSYPNRYRQLSYRGGEFLHENMIKAESLSFVNLSIYKSYSRYRIFKNRIDELLREDKGIDTIVVFSLDYSILRAVYDIKKAFGKVHVCVIVTDLFQFMVFPKSIGAKFIRSFFVRETNRFLKCVDSYVLMTEAMKDKLALDGKPYTIIEGIFNENQSVVSNDIDKEENPTIFYSGTLAKIYGITHLLNAFSKIQNSNYRLWICGDGDAKDDVLRSVLEDKRVTYFGQVDREKVLHLQKQATVLVNPRFSKDDFTKYSFASKTMEYLASGTPVIMHPLECLSEEYKRVMYICEDESDIGLMNKIIEVCELSAQERMEIGERASVFIRSEKTSIKQAQKILRMLRNEK